MRWYGWLIIGLIILGLVIAFYPSPNNEFRFCKEIADEDLEDCLNDPWYLEKYEHIQSCIEFDGTCLEWAYGEEAERLLQKSYPMLCEKHPSLRFCECDELGEWKFRDERDLDVYEWEKIYGCRNRCDTLNNLWGEDIKGCLRQKEEWVREVNILREEGYSLWSAERLVEKRGIMGCGVDPHEIEELKYYKDYPSCLRECDDLMKEQTCVKAHWTGEEI